jgi:hypothetical protein
MVYLYLSPSRYGPSSQPRLPGVSCGWVREPITKELPLDHHVTDSLQTFLSIRIQHHRIDLHTKIFLHFNHIRPRPILVALGTLSSFATLHAHVTTTIMLQHTTTRWAKSFPTVVSVPLSQYTCSYEHDQKICKKTFTRQCDLRSVFTFSPHLSSD